MNEKMLHFNHDISVERNAVYRRTLALIVNNELGTLRRVIELFSDHGHNIESLTVSEVDHGKKVSRITIVVNVTEVGLEEMCDLLGTLDFVHKVSDLTLPSAPVERELALVKIHSGDKNRAEAIKIADIFTARIVDSTPESFVFEVTGGDKKIDEFIALMEPLGLVEVSRTGITAMGRGKQGI
jgi:acetolactate synthase-1/3 small subunit